MSVFSILNSHCSTFEFCWTWVNKSKGFLTITSLLSMISAVKWYWGNWTEILPPSMETGACRWTTARWNPHPDAPPAAAWGCQSSCQCLLPAGHSPWIWSPSSSPAHTPGQPETYCSRTSLEWIGSTWSCFHLAPPPLSPCGRSWHWEALWQAVNQVG